MRALWLMALMAAGCAKSQLSTIQVDGHELQVELARTHAEQSEGLMHRDSMPDDQGMLFIYDDVRKRSFWMKNTRIPLSIAYIDRDGVIVHMADMTPFSADGVPSLYPVKYALEVNQGWFAAHEVDKGDRVTGLESLPEEPSGN